MSWTPTNTYGEWGQIRVTVDGRDVTYFRDQLTIVGGWQDTDPYGSNNASLAFPQVTAFDTIGSGDLAWLRKRAKVRIDHHLDGTLVKNLFIGILDKPEITEAGVSATCTGFLVGRSALALHQPRGGRRKVRDIGEAIVDELHAGDGEGRFTVLPLGGIETGIQTATRGSRDMTRLGYLDYCLGMAVKANGDSLTLLPDPTEGAQVWRMQWRDLTTQHATVDAGAHGVKVRVSSDLADDVDRVYGEGVSPNGERWRNAVYPRLGEKTVPPFPHSGPLTRGMTDADTDTGDGITVLVRELWGNGHLEADDRQEHEFTEDVEDAVKDVQRDANVTADGVVTEAVWALVFSDTLNRQSFAQAHFRPLAADPRTHYYLRAADGTIIGINPEFDPQHVPVDAFQAYGEGTTKRRAIRNAQAIVNRSGGWAGTVTLTSDPAEMSRFDLRAGMNIRVRHLPGGLAQLLHIASVQVDWSSDNQPVTLAVSTQGRHFLDLATRRERNREARRDPGMAFKHMLRSSARTSDTISGWEGESGAGIINPYPLVGGQWNVVPMVAAEGGVIGRLRLVTDAPTPYICALFADRVHADVLNNRLGNPFTWVNTKDEVDVFMDNTDWLVEDERLMVEYWGTPAQPCGYWPKPHTNAVGETTAHPVTGVHRDDASWEFWTTNDWLYLAVWPLADTTIRGRARIQITEGV